MATILDATCGSRSMWFQKNRHDVVYMDNRVGEWETKTRTGVRKVVVSPDVVASFMDMPFRDDTFDLVVFDPPHIGRTGNESRFAHMYGRLFPDWETDLNRGFEECFRVLKKTGYLIFKWSESEISLSRVLSLTTAPPLFGQTGRSSSTHWITFSGSNPL
jgi:ubiquinone/menaquinone biosynthesis C-methylase UbiE